MRPVPEVAGKPLRAEGRLRSGVLAGLVLLAAPAAAAELSCPLAVGPGTPLPGGFALIGSAPRAERPLSSASIVNGPPGEEQATAPATLAPDDESKREGRIVQLWRLADYRKEGLLLVCRYRGTAAYLRAAIPDSLATCSMTLPPSGAPPFEAACR